jgi:hypothetical protein
MLTQSYPFVEMKSSEVGATVPFVVNVSYYYIGMLLKSSDRNQQANDCQRRKNVSQLTRNRNVLISTILYNILIYKYTTIDLLLYLRHTEI